MTRFKPAEIERLLSQPARNRATAEVPEGFFEDMEQRILGATVDPAPEAKAETQKPASRSLHMPKMPKMPKISKMPKTDEASGVAGLKHIGKPWIAAAAAAAVLIVSGVSIALFGSHDDAPVADSSTAAPTTIDVQSIDKVDDIYAVNEESDASTIEELEEIYEADVFLEEMSPL